MADGDWPPLSPIATGLACRCPRCGRGRLFDGFLKLADRCEECGLDFGPSDSGDGPAVLVIFVLGFGIMPFVMWLEFAVTPPYWVHLAIWPATIIILALIILRPAKAIMVGYQYKNLPHVYEEPKED